MSSKFRFKIQGYQMDIFKEITKLQSEYCVFLDSGIENDATRTNIQQIFDTYSPKTKVEIL